LTLIRSLETLAEDEAFQNEWQRIKRQNKEKLMWWIKENSGIDVNINSLFDVQVTHSYHYSEIFNNLSPFKQVKRIHEYKRQLMNILYVIHRYLEIKRTPIKDRAAKFQSRTIMFGGKAAPGYVSAKRIIKLINAVAEKVWINIQFSNRT